LTWQDRSGSIFPDDRQNDRKQVDGALEMRWVTGRMADHDERLRLRQLVAI
jgi:hypothetical protein